MYFLIEDFTHFSPAGLEYIPAEQKQIWLFIWNCSPLSKVVLPWRWNLPAVLCALTCPLCKILLCRVIFAGKLLDGWMNGWVED